MKRSAAAAFITLTLTLLPLQAAEVVRVATLSDGVAPESASFLSHLEDETRRLTRNEFDVRFDPQYQLHGDWTSSSIEGKARQLLDDDEVDVIIALGMVASQIVSRREDLPRPVIATIVLDPEMQGIPREGASSGVHNLSYLVASPKLRENLDAFHDIAPFRKVGILVSEALLETVPGLQSRVDEAMRDAAYGYDIVPVSRSASGLADALKTGTDAVYLTPLPQLAPEEWRSLAESLTARHITTFSWSGTEDVRRGAFAGIGEDDIEQRLARRVALSIQRTLLGEDPGTFPVHFATHRQLTINMETARRIDVYPRWETLLEARLLNAEDEPAARSLTLGSAVDEAVRANLGLLARARSVAAGAEEPRIARAALLPRIDSTLSSVRIDEDRASSLFFPQAESTTSAALRFRQLIYSDPALANLTIQQGLQRSREADLEQLRLDVTQQAATAYLNVLRARSLREVQRDNLRLTRSHLELARVRDTIGVARPAEVVRWESELARDKQAVVEAHATLRQAEIALNRILDRPIEERFDTTEIGIDDPALISSESRLLTYANNPRGFSLMRDFMVREGIARSPELREIDQLIDAQERALLSARRSFTLPTLALQGELAERLSESGAGSSTPDLPFAISTPDDTTWSLALTLSYPIFTGLERSAEVVRQNEKLAELRLTRRSLANVVEARIRAAMHQANASYQTIRLSRDAARSASRNLELVTDAYSQGVVSILELIDAQNAALASNRAAANAVHEFLIDLMEVERAVNRFDFGTSSAERQQWIDGVREFMRDSGVTLD